MNVLTYILSDFWAWLGAMCLIVCLSNGIANVFAAARPCRKVRISQKDDFTSVEIENATDSDVASALTDIQQNRRESDNHD